MKFKDLNPTIIELAAPYIFHRIQLIRSRTTSVQMNGVAMPPVGLMYGRYCLPDEPLLIWPTARRRRCTRHCSGERR